MLAHGDFNFGTDEDEPCRGRYCCEIGCPATGLWHPAILLHTEHGLRRGDPIVSIHHFCDSHYGRLRVEGFVTAEFWTMIESKFGTTGPAPPDRFSCKLVFFHKKQLTDSDIQDL